MFMPQNNFSFIKSGSNFLELGKIKNKNYRTAEPFPHIILDDFVLKIIHSRLSYQLLTQQ